MQIYEKDPINYAIALNDLAECYRKIGKYAEAEPLLRQSLKQYERYGQKDQYYAIINNNLGLVYFSLGIYDKAELCYSNSKKTCNNLNINDSYYYTILNNIACLYREQGKYTEAENYHKQALAYCNKSLPMHHPEHFATRYNLGQLFLLQGKTAEAQAMYAECLELSAKTHGKKSMEYSAALNTLSTIYSANKDTKKSRSYLLQSLQILETIAGKNTPNYARVLSNIGDTYYAEHNYTEATKYYAESHDILTVQTHENFAILSESEKMQYIKLLQNNEEIQLNLALDTRKETGEAIEQCFDNTLFIKSVILYNSIAQQQVISATNNVALQQAYEQWVIQKDSLYRFDTGQLPDPDINRNKLLQATNDSEKKISRLADAENIQNPTLGVAAKQNTIREVQTTLSDDEIAIEFVNFRRFNGSWTDTVYYCALIQQKIGKPMLKYIGTEDALRKIIHRPANMPIEASYIKHLYDTSVRGGVGDSLYRFLWQPLQAEIGNRSNVYISPCGLLHQISFAAIPCNDSLRLLNKHKIKYLTSTKELINKQPLIFSKNTTASLWGGICYSCKNNAPMPLQTDNAYSVLRYTADFSLDSLQASYDEIINIKKVLMEGGASTSMHSGQNAKEADFKNIENDSITYLHISTHGYYLPYSAAKEQPFLNKSVQTPTPNSLLANGIMLSCSEEAWRGNAPTNSEDGILTAYEVALNWLPTVRLAVLSACQTGLGSVEGHEGVIGLRRAFKMAGVEYLLLSLWNVPDYQTKELMSKMYYHFAQGDEITVALANAQKEMSTLPPYYWAGFVLIK